MISHNVPRLLLADVGDWHLPTAATAGATSSRHLPFAEPVRPIPEAMADELLNLKMQVQCRRHAYWTRPQRDSPCFCKGYPCMAPAVDAGPWLRLCSSAPLLGMLPYQGAYSYFVPTYFPTRGARGQKSSRIRNGVYQSLTACVEVGAHHITHHQQAAGHINSWHAGRLFEDTPCRDNT